MAAAFADDSLDVNIYSRFSNPTVDEFVRKICVLEGAEDGMATASGMAAIFATFMALLSKGDHVISASAVFGSTHTILTRYLPKWGIDHSYFDTRAPDTIPSLFRPETRLLYVETPSNPGLDIVDIAALARLCRERGCCWSWTIVSRRLPCSSRLPMVPTWSFTRPPSSSMGRAGCLGAW